MSLRGWRISRPLLRQVAATEWIYGIDHALSDGRTAKYGSYGAGLPALPERTPYRAQGRCGHSPRSVDCFAWVASDGDQPATDAEAGSAARDMGRVTPASVDIQFIPVVLTRKETRLRTPDFYPKGWSFTRSAGG